MVRNKIIISAKKSHLLNRILFDCYSAYTNAIPSSTKEEKEKALCNTSANTLHNKCDLLKISTFLLGEYDQENRRLTFTSKFATVHLKNIVK